MCIYRYENALVLEDDAVFDPQFPALLQQFLALLEPDWGVVFTDAATSCHWWGRGPDSQARGVRRVRECTDSRDWRLPIKMTLPKSTP